MMAAVSFGSFFIIFCTFVCFQTNFLFLVKAFGARNDGGGGLIFIRLFVCLLTANSDGGGFIWKLLYNTTYVYVSVFKQIFYLW